MVHETQRDGPDRPDNQTDGLVPHVHTMNVLEANTVVLHPARTSSRLRRDIAHRQPQSAQQHFRMELIALVDHDMRVENGESGIQATHMFVLNDVRRCRCPPADS